MYSQYDYENADEDFKKAFPQVHYSNTGSVLAKNRVSRRQQLSDCFHVDPIRRWRFMRVYNRKKSPTCCPSCRMRWTPVNMWRTIPRSLGRTCRLCQSIRFWCSKAVDRRKKFWQRLPLVLFDHVVSFLK